MSMIVKLFAARNDYLDRNELDVLDDSPFKEFVLECIGKPVEQMRAAMEKGLKKIKEGKRFKFDYIPKDGVEIRLPNFNFENQSGNLIKNKNHLTKLK